MTMTWRPSLYIALACLLIAACGDVRSPPRHTVTVAVAEGGSANPGSQSVGSGNSATITFTPSTGYTLASASGCGGSLNGSIYTTGPISGDCTVSASFELRSYTVSASAGPGGSITPSVQTVTHGEGTSFVVTANTHFSIGQVSGCGGSLEGSNYLIASVTQPCSVSASFEPQGGSLSGTITPAASITVDTTLNDSNAEFQDNSGFDTAQPVNNLITLHGFASATATGTSAPHQQFVNEPDPSDFYRVALQAGQRIQLLVADHKDNLSPGEQQNDLDLYLYDSERELVTASFSTTAYEEIVVEDSGDYFIEVHAHSGISKYVLRLLPSLDGIAASPRLEFVPDEIIIEFYSQPLAGLSSQGEPHQQLSQHLHASTGLELQYQHSQRNRATLARLDRSSAAMNIAQVNNRKTQHQNRPGSDTRISTLRAIKHLRQQPQVRNAEPNYILHSQRIPNDPQYNRQWHYQIIQLPQAWDISIGERPEGEEVIVAVIDTGVFLDHPDLAGQLVPGYDFISDPERARDGDGIDPNPDDPGDNDLRGQSSWHGTHVAGTIAAATNNNIGVAGVAWGARIMPVRALGKNGGTSYDVMQSVRYAAGLENDSGTLPTRRADIINLSLGGPNSSLAEQALYTQILESGVIVVAAAGNNNSANPFYPAAYEGVLSVSATDAANQKAPYSNFGPTISLAAPGGNMSTDLNGDGLPDGVYSTLVDDRSGTRLPAYRFYHGTSMAAPHVSGVLALMKAIYPDLTPQLVKQLLASGQLTDDLGEPGRDDIYGHGLINALSAVRIAVALQEGEEPDEWPALLAASPAILNLGQTTNAQLTIRNDGGGNPTVTGSSNADWLILTPLDTEQGLGSYGVSIDRTELGDGIYQGRLTFTTEGETELRVAVYMQVGEVSTAGELTQMYVLLLDGETRVPRYETMTQAVDGELHYHFTWVNAGDYWVVAGSDIDVDRIICQPGESCGAYPSLDSQQRVTITDSNRDNLNFVADIIGNFSNLGSAASNDQEYQQGIPRKPTQNETPLRRVAE